MHAVFLVDAGPEIGFGHLARSFVLARALRARRFDVTLVVRRLHGAGGWPARLSDADLGHVEVDAALLTDPACRGALLERVASFAPTNLVVDHYGVEPPTVAALVACFGDVTRLEDHGRASWSGERVLCPIPALGPASGVPGSSEGGLYGPRFALVDPTYRVARARAVRRSRCTRLLVSCGGSDPVDLTRKAVDGALASRFEGEIDVVIGPAYKWRDALRSSPAAHHPRLTLHEGVTGLVELLLAADLALGAPGHTTWERACLGVPSLLALQAENQTGLAQFVEARGAARVLGWADRVAAADIAQAIDELCAGGAALAAQSACAAELVDGFGAERVADALQGLSVRRATADDAELLFGWANEPSARSASLNPESIPWDTHVRWLDGVLNSSTRTLLVGELRGTPLGQCRLDHGPGSALVSVSLDPRWRGQGLARPFLAAALREHGLEVPLVALVKERNDASLALFRGLGFVEDGVAAAGVLRLCCQRFVG